MVTRSPLPEGEVLLEVKKDLPPDLNRLTEPDCPAIIQVWQPRQHR